MTDLSSHRRQYAGERLVESALPTTPLSLFEQWMDQALAAALVDATAMTLSTVGADGHPSARVVLLKSWDARGFVFFTRYSTHKADDLLHERRTSLLFHWRELDRQVRIEGEASRIDRQDSETYFATRPRESQLAARAASGQRRIVGATWLRERFEQEAATFAGKPVAMPDDWGGYRVVARRFEFWQGRPDRMHDRIVYELEQDGAWSTHRLAP